MESWRAFIYFYLNFTNLHLSWSFQQNLIDLKKPNIIYEVTVSTKTKQLIMLCHVARRLSVRPWMVKGIISLGYNLCTRKELELDLFLTSWQIWGKSCFVKYFFTFASVCSSSQSESLHLINSCQKQITLIDLNLLQWKFSMVWLASFKIRRIYWNEHHNIDNSR